MPTYRTARQARRGFEVFINRVGNRLLNNLTRELARATPVDTGRAQSGWRRTRKYDVRRRKSIVIRNRVPYIQVLNEGHSKQAPSGFIQKVIRRVLRQDHNKRG